MIIWRNVQKILVVRLRSIGDTVLSTPSLIALREFLPDAQIDILLEDWVAPVLEDFETVDNVLSVSKNTKDRIKIARKLRKEKYDVAFNLHGGTTATFLIRASGATHRVGYESYQYSFLYNHLLTSAREFWQKEQTHSAEQQLALLGFVGVPVENRPKTSLGANAEVGVQSSKFRVQGSEFGVQGLEIEKNQNLEDKRESKIREPTESQNLKYKIALFHPAAAFDSKQWATENFARIAENLAIKGFTTFAVATKKERDVLDNLEEVSKVTIKTFDNLTLPEISSLASQADLFLGNDSGIAHIAAAVGTPSVVIFGSSNRDHWRPWTDTINEIVFEKMPCQPCPGLRCKEFDKPRCILDISVEKIQGAIDRVLDKKSQSSQKKPRHSFPIN